MKVGNWTLKQARSIDCNNDLWSVQGRVIGNVKFGGLAKERRKV